MGGYNCSLKIPNAKLYVMFLLFTDLRTFASSIKDRRLAPKLTIAECQQSGRNVPLSGGGMGKGCGLPSVPDTLPECLVC